MFAALFPTAHAVSSGLFASAAAQFSRGQPNVAAAVGDADTSTAAAAAATAAAAAAAAAAGGQQDKKRRKHAREEPGAAAAAAAAAPAVAGLKRGTADADTGGARHRQQAAAGVPAEAAQQQQQEQAAVADERLPRTLFVGNLPATIKRKAVAALFSECGAVESVRLRSLPLTSEAAESKMPRRGAIASGGVDAGHSGHAYVVFESEASLEAALALNMRLEVEGRHLRVDRAAPKSVKGGVQFDWRRSLFVGNLPHDVQDEEVIRLFGAASVEAVRVVRDARSGAGKGVAFVLFRDQEQSKAALRQHRGAELKGRRLRVTVVKQQQQGGASGGDGKAAWQQGKSDSSKAPKGGKPAQGKRKSGGKRPSVAARKQATKGTHKKTY